MAEADGQTLSELSTSELSKLDWLKLLWAFWWRGSLLLAFLAHSSRRSFGHPLQEAGGAVSSSSLPFSFLSRTLDGSLERAFVGLDWPWFVIQDS